MDVAKHREALEEVRQDIRALAPQLAALRAVEAYHAKKAGETDNSRRRCVSDTQRRAPRSTAPRHGGKEKPPKSKPYAKLRQLEAAVEVAKAHGGGPCDAARSPARWSKGGFVYQKKNQ